jgi:SAM-dependent methyltransferase
MESLSKLELLLPKEPSVRKPVPEKFILDSTAGYRMMHVNKENPHVLYTDLRSEVNPDEVQDFRSLPYPDESFRLVIFDPPHRTLKDAPHWVKRDYGGLVPETWQSDLRKGFRELWRVLQPFGILVFKWNNHQFPLTEVTPLFPAKPVIQQVTTNGTSSDTFWVLFMKIKEERV